MFPGFEKPTANFSKLPHGLIDALPIVDSLAELKVILYVLRHTWGYQEYSLPKRITMDEFENGRKLADGNRLDSGVGMVKNSIKSGIAKAIEHGFLIRKREQIDDMARSSYVYALAIRKEGQELTFAGSKTDPRTEKDTSNKETSVNYVNTRDESIDEFLLRVPESTRGIAEAFCYMHGRPPLDSEEKYWRKCWNEQHQLGFTPDLVVKAYHHMDKEKLTVKSPRSLNAVAERLRKDGTPMWEVDPDNPKWVKLGDVKYPMPQSKDKPE